jgi:hypothetical protein
LSRLAEVNYNVYPSPFPGVFVLLDPKNTNDAVIKDLSDITEDSLEIC